MDEKKQRGGLGRGGLIKVEHLTLVSAIGDIRLGGRTADLGLGRSRDWHWGRWSLGKGERGAEQGEQQREAKRRKFHSGSNAEERPFLPGRWSELGWVQVEGRRIFDQDRLPALPKGSSLRFF